MMSANRVYYSIRHIVYNAKVTREKCVRAHKRHSMQRAKSSHCFTSKRSFHIYHRNPNPNPNPNKLWFFALIAVGAYLSKS